MSREYKSDVFSMLLEDKANALEVYNALNNTNYTDPEEVEIVKLEKGVSLSIRNDASFIIDMNLSFYEHQSTYNPNMPLRSMIYFANTIEEWLKENDRDLFSERLIRIPTNGNVEEAVDTAIEECIREHILEDFFRTRKDEVKKMTHLDYTWEQREKLIRKEEYEQGMEQGIKQGLERGMYQVAENMLLANKPLEEIMAFTGISIEKLKGLATELQGE